MATLIVQLLQFWKREIPDDWKESGRCELTTDVGKDVGCDAQITDDTAFCWMTEVRSYLRRASVLLCPVLSIISFSGTFASNNLVAPIARRLVGFTRFTYLCAHVFHHGSKGVASHWLHLKPNSIILQGNVSLGFPVEYKFGICQNLRRKLA